MTRGRAWGESDDQGRGGGSHDQGEGLVDVM